MKTCKFCAYENNDEALFCAHCGARLDDTSSVEIEENVRGEGDGGINGVATGGTGDGFFDDPVTSENQGGNSQPQNGGRFDGNGGNFGSNGSNFGGYGNAYNGYGYNGGYNSYSPQTPPAEDIKATEFKNKARGLNKSGLFLIIAIAFTVSAAISVISPILSGSFGFDLFTILITIATWKIYLSSKNNGTITGYNLLSGTTKVFAILEFIGAFFVFIAGFILMISAEYVVEILNTPEFEEIFIENQLIEQYQWIIEFMTVDFLMRTGIELLVITAVIIIQGLCLLHYSKLVKGFVINFNRGVNDVTIYSKTLIYLILNIAASVVYFVAPYVILPSLMGFDIFTVLDIAVILCEIAALVASILLVKKLKEIE